ncbi:cysteine--tRNA ligase [Seohaeicola zhoushanensis]
MTTIRLHNTRTRSKEEFIPIDPDNVRMYVCGPTVYDRAHLGNARPVVVFDVLYRLLKQVYGAGHVTYVRNITDVEDKIIDRAAERGIAIDELTRTTTDWFHQDMAALGVDYSADAGFREPKATEHIGGMIAMIEDLIANGNAYAAEGHVLFRVRSYADYGKLGPLGRRHDRRRAGRGGALQGGPNGLCPLETLQRRPARLGQPLGRGRPGWHIECSAMSLALLGESFDIHGGGIDLQFPHHENEIAQSCCAHPRGQFARYWLHNEMLQVEGKKMSKSLGNFFTVRDLLDQGVPGEVIRFVFLSTHYRKPMDWTEAKAAGARRTLRKWYEQTTDDTGAGEVDPAILRALSNDLNTHEAIATLHDLSTRGESAALAASLRFLGLLGESAPEWAAESPVDAGTTALIEQLLAARAEARKSRDFARADALRDGIAAAGVIVMDSASGSTWDLGPDFDLAKLEALK